MQNKLVLAILILVAMAVSSLTAAYLTPTTLLADQLPAVKLDYIFPKTIGPWVMEENQDISIPNPDTEKTIKSIYTDTLARAYTYKGKSIFLSIAYGKNQSDGTALHYPEICYPAQGFIISSKHKNKIKINQAVIPVKQLIAQRGDMSEPITYWATIGDKIILNGTEHKVAQLQYGFRGFIPDGFIIRVSSIGPQQAAEYEVQRQFLESLMQALTLPNRKRLLGEYI